MQDRREFMRNLGVALATLLAARCSPFPTPTPTCYVPLPPTTSGSGGSDDWDALREAWRELDVLAGDAPDLERGEATRDRLMADHRAALDALVAADELDAAVADDLQVAFSSAAYHVWRANSPITCYEPMAAPDYRVEGSSDLARQADVLAEMAASSSVDPATVAEAQASIERDIAFLTMTSEDQQALIEAVMQAAGDTWDWPSLAQVELDIPPESLQAAQILVALLLEQK